MSEPVTAGSTAPDVSESTNGRDALIERFRRTANDLDNIRWDYPDGLGDELRGLLTVTATYLEARADKEERA